MGSKKRDISDANRQKRNVEIAQKLAEKHAKEDAEQLKEVQKKLKNAKDTVNFVIGRNSSSTTNLEWIKKNIDVVISHPMFRSKAGYFNWQLSALTWIYGMEKDITNYLNGELFKMQEMINAIKEE